jgi:predicted PurR-regulated permease PerM
VGAQEKENPVLLGFAMLGGTYAFGPLGLILGPLAISLTGAVVHELHSLGPIVQEVSSGTTNDLAEQSPEVKLATSQAVQSLVEET